MKKMHSYSFWGMFLCGLLLIVKPYPLYATSLPENNTFQAHEHALMSDWQKAMFQTNERSQQIAALQHVHEQAMEFGAAYPDNAEPLIWQGIALASQAQLIKNSSVLQQAKDARDLFLKSIAIDPQAMDGSALTMLATLYHALPGWPFAFGDDKKAETYFRQAVESHPDNRDANFLYASFLTDKKRYADAKRYLQIAENAPNRPGYELADKARADEIQALKAKLAVR